LSHCVLISRYPSGMGGGGNKLALAAAGLCLTLAFGAPGAVAQDDREHALVLKMGPAGEWPSHDRANFGGTFAVEKSIIENWLEIEVGLTMLGTTGQRELSGDIIFKKPFRISPNFEFMIGVGPSISRTLNGEDQSTTVSAAFTLDFMFWPTPNVGWFVEPTWTVNPRNGQQSFAASVGLLIGIPQR
jgi:hypothetical protein